MGVYIKDMEMPTSCSECPLHKLWPMDDEVQCLVNRELWNDNSERHKLCPLVPVHPHGRLIDADALIRELEITEEDDHNGATLLMAVFLEVLKSAPSIIPAEEGET